MPATGAVVGALRVVLGADTAALEKGMKDAQGVFSRWANDVSKIVAGVGIERGLEKLVEGIVGSIKHAVTAADELGKAAQKVGMPVEELSALKYAADLADVSFETLTKSLVKFDKALGEAAGGAQNDLTKALDAMKIPLQDGNGAIKSQSQLLEEIADKFAGYEDSAQKTALAVKAFGKAGAELIPLLNMGAEGIRKAKEEARLFGIIVSKDAADKSETFNDNLKRLATVAHGLAVVFAGELIDSLSGLSEGFVKASSDAQKLATVKETVRSWAQALGKEILQTSVMFQLAGDRFSAYWKAVAKGGVLTEDGRKAIEDYRRAVMNQDATIAGITARTNEWALAWQGLGDKAAAAGKKTKENAPGVAGDAKNAFDQFIASQQKSIAAQEAANVTFGQTSAAIEAMKIQTLALNAAQEAGFAKLTPAMQKQVDLLKQRGAEAAATQQGLQIKDEVRTSWEIYNDTIDRNTQLLAQGKIDVQTYERANKKAAQGIGETWEQTGASIASIAGSFSSLTKTLGKENKAMGIASKAFGIAQVIINTQIAAMKAWAELGPIAGPLAAAAAVAAGAASIATIAAQGFAQGGSFIVPGGVSRVDNQMMMVPLAAGEQVDVTPASHDTSPANVTIDMRGNDGIYTRSAVERMLNAMHTVLADGHRVQLVVLK